MDPYTCMDGILWKIVVGDLYSINTCLLTRYASYLFISRVGIDLAQYLRSATCDYGKNLKHGTKAFRLGTSDSVSQWAVMQDNLVYLIFLGLCPTRKLLHVIQWRALVYCWTCLKFLSMHF